MAQQTAQYEALQYGQDKIPDFGAIAMAGAKRVTELQEAERKRKDDELKFRMDMIKDNPEVAYASFENSGLKNLDAYNTKVSELVKDRFNQLNEQFNTDGDKTAYVMGVSKLKGEVMNFANQVSPMIQYGQKIVELGDGASAVMYDNAESIDGMLQHGVPSMDKDGNIVNTSIIPQEDGSFKKENVGFSEMTSLTSIHERQDKFSVAANAVKSFGSDSRFIDEQGNVVLDTLLTKDGKMNLSAAKIIKANVSSLDRSSLIDIADQFGLYPQYGPGREILNKQELIDDISEREIDYAVSLMQERQTEDEGAYRDLDLKTKALNLRYQQEKRLKGEKVKSSSFSYTPKMASQYTNIFGQEGVGFVEHIMKDDKDKFVSALPNFIDILAPTLSGPLTKDEDKSAFSTIKGGIIQSLWEHSNGQHGVVVTVPNEIGEKYEVAGLEKIKWKGVTNTYFFPIQSNTQANILRAKFDLGDMNPEQKKYWTPTAQTSQNLVTGELD